MESVIVVFLFFKQKTAYEMRISDWSSDVCSSDLRGFRVRPRSVEPGLCSTGGNHGAGHMVLGDIQLLASRRGQYGDDRTVRDARAERALATSVTGRGNPVVLRHDRA